MNLLTLPREGMIHVWHLDCAAWTARESSLSHDESEQALKYHRPSDRRLFVATRSVLRVLLSRYLNRRAEQLQFDKGVCGKPVLRGENGMHFNVSHSGSHAALAFSQEEVGIDLEKEDDKFNVQELARQFFAEEEKAKLEDQTGVKARQLFYRYWVRKEAYLKAKGVGLQEDLARYSMDFSGKSSGKVDRWIVEDLKEASPGYFAAACGLIDDIPSRIEERWYSEDGAS